MLSWFDRTVTWPLAIIACLTLGLAPFVPEPHVWQKLKMLFDGTLVRPLDVFDLFFHGITWLALFLKIGITLSRRR